MDRVYAAALCQVDNRRNVQISANRALIFANEIGFVCMGTELTAGILVGVHCHGMESQVIACPENSNGNFTTVCSQNLIKGFLCHMITSLQYYGRHLSFRMSTIVHSAFIILHRLSYVKAGNHKFEGFYARCFLSHCITSPEKCAKSAKNTTCPPFSEQVVWNI